MNLFINTLSDSATIILFNFNREIIDSNIWKIKGNESSTLIPELDKLLNNNNVNYLSLKNIIVVNGPGSFTGIRATILAVNTINYIIKNNMTAINFFKLFNNYPIIKSSSKRDCFIKMDKDSEIEIINNEKLNEIFNKNNITKVYGEANSNIFSNIEIIEKIDYLSIIKNIKYDNKQLLEPLYIKKPSIS